MFQPSSFITKSLLFAAALLFMALPIEVLGTQETSPPLAWDLQADSMQTTKDGEVITAKGHVLLIQADNYIQADYATYNKLTQKIYLEGHIKAKWDDDFLEADTADFHLAQRVGWMTNAQVFIEANHVSLTGETIHKTGNATYTFEQATMTSCDGIRPAWSLKASSGEVTVDGYARLWHPRLRIKDQPILYVPYFVVPVKTKRQSGFLLPDLTISKQLGTHINLPYYHVIDEETDLTLYENLMTKRGLMQGIEFRHTPDLDTRTLLWFDWLKDQQAYEDGTYTSLGWQRPHTNRYWLRGKYDGYFFSPLLPTKFDVDLVSDYHYLREFSDGLSGFNQSRKDFTKVFGRDIRDNDNYLRENILSIRRDWADLGLECRMEYTQNLAYFNDNTGNDPARNPTLQRLPEINLYVYKHQWASTMLEWEATSQYTYFWREYGTTGSRLDVHPTISLPLSFAYGTMIPSLGWRETLYAVDRFEHAEPTVHTDTIWHLRGIPDASLEMASHLFKVYDLHTPLITNTNNLGTSAWTAIKHAISPNLTYSWRPNTLAQQHQCPQFDTNDAIPPESNLTYSLTNVLTRKRLTVLSDPAAQGNATTTKADYLNIFRFKLEQSYDFREAQRSRDSGIYPNRPFSDIKAELTISPEKYLNLTSTSWYSPYRNRITEHEHMAHVFLDDLLKAYCGLDFVNREQEYENKTNYLGVGGRSRILTLGGDMALPRNWFLAINYKTDLAQGKDLDRSIDLTYKHQCFTFGCTFSKTDTDEKIAVQITLSNLGSMKG